MNNSLIYGKDSTKSVVALEDNGNGTVDIFTQNSNGDVTSQTLLSEYWILTTEPVDEMSIKLEGNREFKYKNTFAHIDDFNYAKKSCYRTKKAKENSYIVHDLKEQCMLQSGITMFKGMKHQEVSVLSFDLETTTLKHTSDAKILLISNTYRDTKGIITRKLFAYDDFESEKQMLCAWCHWVRECNPSIVLGHNIFNFDFPYLDYIAKRNHIELCLGRNSKGMRFNSYESQFRKDGSQTIGYHRCYIHGREIVDTMFLSIKYDITRKYVSYGLKPIIDHEGLQIAGRQFYDASLIRKNYMIPDEWVKIKKYAEHDADDALSLWDLMGPSQFYWTQSVPKSLQEVVCTATGSQLNSILVRSYLQDNGSIPKANNAVHFRGAISLGNPGIYSHGLKLDIKSMYPSIIIQYELFNKQKDPKGHFLIITKEFTRQRFENKDLAEKTKNKYYTDMEQSQKIGINSLFGLKGAPGLNFNSPDIGEFITTKGREILTYSIKWFTGKDLHEFNYDKS